MSASQNKPPIIRELHAADSTWLETLHAACFEKHQQWNAHLFNAMLAQPATKGLVLIINEEPAAFIIGRHIVDEAEILTIATSPQYQRQGYAHMLVEAFINQHMKEGLETLFLEVNVESQSAIALYKKLGFHIVATRPDYYQMPEGSEKKFMDGYVMKKKI